MEGCTYAAIDVSSLPANPPWPLLLRNTSAVRIVTVLLNLLEARLLSRKSACRCYGVSHYATISRVVGLTLFLCPCHRVGTASLACHPCATKALYLQSLSVRLRTLPILSRSKSLTASLYDSISVQAPRVLTI